MSWLKKLLLAKLTSDRADRRFGQWFCFALCPALMYFGITAVCRNTTNAGELTIGMLVAINLSLMPAVVGVLMPLLPVRQSDLGKESD